MHFIEALGRLQYTLNTYSIQCTVYSIHTAHIIQCPVSSVQYTVHVQCTVSSTQSTVYIVQYTVYTVHNAHTVGVCSRRQLTNRGLRASGQILLTNLCMCSSTSASICQPLLVFLNLNLYMLLFLSTSWFIPQEPSMTYLHL